MGCQNSMDGIVYITIIY